VIRLLETSMADGKKKVDIFSPIASRGDNILGVRIRDGAVDFVEAERVKHGKPINTENDLLSLRSRDDGAFDVETIYKGKNGTGRGPAQVATHQYRKGWDEVFGKPPKREDMN
jgi:hypothetical protein